MNGVPSNRASLALTGVAPGADLLESLARLAGAGEAWISGTGHIEAVELRVARDGTDLVRALSGRFTMLQLSGPSGGPFTATLARASDAGFDVIGGEIVRARSAGVTVAIQHAAATAVAPVGEVADAGASAKVVRDERQGTPRAGAPMPMWARAAAVSAEAEARAEEDELEESAPEVGDLVEHFAFGRCEVLTAEGDRLRIRDVKSPGRVREVALAMLSVVGPTEFEGKRLFRLVRRGSSA